MDADPARRGRAVAALFFEHAPALLADLLESRAWGATTEDPSETRREWEVFALYACVRGLVAGGGFNIETAAAIDALHEAVMDGWSSELGVGETLEQRRALVAARYEEYGAIGQEGGKSGAATVTQRLGDAAAHHMAGADAAPETSETVGTLHESLVEAVSAQLRGF